MYVFLMPVRVELFCPVPVCFNYIVISEFLVAEPASLAFCHNNDGIAHTRDELHIMLNHAEGILFFIQL